MTDSSSLFDTIAGFLHEDDWHFDPDPEAHRLVGTVGGDNGTWRVVVGLEEDPEVRRVTILSVLPVKAPEARRLAVAEALIRLNNDLAAGSFNLDMKDGEMICRSSVDLVDAIPTAGLFLRMLRLNLMLTDQNLHTLLGVAYGSLDPAGVEVMDAAENEVPEGAVVQ